MAGGIRGITVKIGGDTSELGRSLTDASKKSKSLQSELKGVNKLLKFDTGNVTLLKQKEDLLKQSIEETKKKQEALNETLQKVKSGEIEMTEEEMRNLEREIALTDAKLESLEEEFKQFGSVAIQQTVATGEKLKDVGGKIEDAGKKMSIVSAGIAGVAVASIGAFYELDEGYDTIITKTGATGDALDSLTESANNVFGNMPVEMADVGTAIGEVNTRFGYTGKELEDLSTKFLQFAEINGVDLNNSIGTVDKILEQFNMTGEDAGGVLDLISKKAQETGISADQLMKSVQANGATFKDMGLGVNEAIVLLSQFEANGVNVETAVKGLKKATQEYTEQGLSMDEALSKTIESIKNAGSETEALAIAQEIFGTRGANEMAKAIREGRINIDDLSVAMGDYAGTVENTFNATLDPVDRAKEGFNNLKLVGAQLGETIQVALTPLIEGLVNGLKALNEWFSGLSPTVQTVIVVIGGIVASIGPLLIIIGKLVGSIGTIMTFAPQIMSIIGVIKGGLSSLWGVLMTNPIMLIVAGIVALVTALIYAYNHSERFREIVNNAFESIKNVITTVMETIKTVISTAWEFISTVITTVIGLIKAYITAEWNGIKFVITTVLNAIKAVVSVVWNGIKAVISTVVNGIKTLVVTGFNIVKDNVHSIFTAVKSTVSTLWNGIKDAISKVVDGIKEVIRSGFNRVKEIVTDVFATVHDNIVNPINKAKDKISEVVDSIKNKVKNIFKGIKPKLELSLPHIHVDGGKAPWGIGGKGRLPSFSVTWNRLGAVFDQPTIFATPLGFQGVGEAGPEAVAPIDVLQKYVRDAVSERNQALEAKLDKVIGLMSAYYPDSLDALNRPVVLDSGELVGGIIDNVDNALSDKNSKLVRGW